MEIGQWQPLPAWRQEPATGPPSCKEPRDLAITGWFRQPRTKSSGIGSEGKGRGEEKELRFGEGRCVQQPALAAPHADCRRGRRACAGGRLGRRGVVRGEGIGVDATWRATTTGGQERGRRIGTDTTARGRRKGEDEMDAIRPTQIINNQLS